LASAAMLLLSRMDIQGKSIAAEAAPTVTSFLCEQTPPIFRGGVPSLSYY
jgi:hypothetical protein